MSAVTPQSPQPKARSQKPLLDRDAWLRAAGDVVAESGIGGLRILNLAKRLGVTRGSFYWHFQDHADLVRAFLSHWLEYRRHRTHAWEGLMGDVSDPKAALLRSLDIMFDEGRTSMRNIRIELAIRSFATQDPFAAEVLAQSDAMRHGPSQALYARLTHDAERARLLALTSYLIIAGADLVLQGARRDEATVLGLRALVGQLLVNDVTPAPFPEPAARFD